MLKKEIIQKLKNQLNLEFYSANLYLQMSAWCSNKGFEGASAFLKSHSQEEMEHMRRLFDYLDDTGSMPILGAIAAPPINFSSLNDVFEKIYQHEQIITQKINEATHTATTEQDYSTFNLLQWYAAQQHKEEKIFKSILDKLALVNKVEGVLFFVDQALKTMTAAPAQQ
ncbi:MAG: non-heme ferritin [Candidatus Malihini olakiniferum]